MKTIKTAETLHVKYLILGGGITGLSTAYHFEKKGITDYLLVEKENHLGGLCASEQIHGFTFDYSGHLLHLRDPYTLQLVKRLLKGNLLKHKREAFIDFDGRLIPFPFQANLWALPEKIRQNCLESLPFTGTQKTNRPRHFEQWCVQQFGTGIYHYFMRPYNRKLWQIPLTRLTCDWCGDFVPTTSWKQIRAGACRPPKKNFGYNATFYYPKQGGCGALVQALANYVPNVWLHATVQQINFKQKWVLINGKKVFFQYLINTLPLKKFISCCHQTPAGVHAAAAQLKHTPVYVFQFAINRAVPPFHWIYFPQPDIPFFRLGMQSSFSTENAPAGTSSFYVETTEKITHFPKAQRAILNTLCQKGIINKQDKILVSFWRTIPVAYTLYDQNRAKAVRCILAWLQQKHCFCAGRYGRWEYSFIERSLLEGKQLAEDLHTLD